MQIKEVKVVMYMVIQDMPELKTKQEIAEYINMMVHEDEDFFGVLDESNIVDVREYEIRSTLPPEDRETD